MDIVIAVIIDHVRVRKTHWISQGGVKLQYRPSVTYQEECELSAAAEYIVVEVKCYLKQKAHCRPQQ